jgi:hypothetical protein
MGTRAAGGTDYGRHAGTSEMMQIQGLAAPILGPSGTVQRVARMTAVGSGRRTDRLLRAEAVPDTAAFCRPGHASVHSTLSPPTQHDRHHRPLIDKAGRVRGPRNTYRLRKTHRPFRSSHIHALPSSAPPHHTTHCLK